MGISVRHATAADLDAIAALGHAAVDAGDSPGVSHAEIENARPSLAADPSGAIVAVLDGAPVGYIVASNNDLLVGAAHRRRGIGTALAEAGLALCRERGEPYLLLYVPPGDTPGGHFAEARGFRYRATLHWMERPGPDPCPPPVTPAGVTFRPFGGATEDLGAFVALMNASFADHATAVSWTVEGIAARQALPGFDPDGILLAVDAADPSRLVGFTDVAVEAGDDGPIGDIHHIGVLPAWRGRGLGGALLRWGIRTLQARGVPTIGLSVIATNAPALHLYEAHGFRRVIDWPQWSRDA